MATRARIAAEHLSNLPGGAHIIPWAHASPPLPHETTSSLVQQRLQGSPVWPTRRQTDRQTDVNTCVETARI